MALHKSAESIGKLRHSDVTSAHHARHKKHAEWRSRQRFVRYLAPETGPARGSFESLGLRSQAYAIDGESWRACNEVGSYADYLCNKRSELSWFIDTVLRAGRRTRMRRPARPSIEMFTFVHVPWYSDYLYNELREGRDPRPQVREIEIAITTILRRHLLGRRYLIGLSTHCDTQHLHHDYALTRQNGRGDRLPHQGLGLCGAWCVAIARLIRAGAALSGSTRKKFGASMANFERRNGKGSIPLDILLAREADQVVASMVGGQLDEYRHRYVADVPARERARIEAELQAVDEKRGQLSRELDQHRHSARHPRLVTIADIEAALARTSESAAQNRLPGVTR